MLRIKPIHDLINCLRAFADVRPILFCVESCQLIVRNDKIFAEIYGRALACKHAGLVKKPCHTIHLDQVLQIMLFHQPIDCYLKLAVLVYLPPASFGARAKIFETAAKVLKEYE